MRELTSFDYISLVEEMKDLTGKRFQKMSVVPGGYKVKLRGADILFLPPDKLYKTSFSVPSLEPDPFSMKVRKHLEGQKLEEVKVLNVDRIVEMKFEEGSLVFELFREGNVVLLDGEGKIVTVLHPRSWRHRDLKPGVMYNTPPPPLISQGKFYTDSFLIRDLVRSGIPKPYALEVIHCLGADEKEKTKKLDPIDIMSIIQEVLTDLREPSGYLCDGEPFPIQLSYTSCEKKYETFTEAVDSFTPSFFRV